MTVDNGSGQTEYSSEHAELYDEIFRGRGKDFAGEAARVAELVRERNPGASSLLDVACGTGAHLEAFQDLFDRVEGVELAPAMLDVAQKRLPDAELHLGDMRELRLPDRFDAITCLGNSVACVDSSEEMAESVSRMAAHLNPGGVLVVEPWWFPGNFIDGHVGGHLQLEPGRAVCRMTRAVRKGDRTRHEVRFLLADDRGFHQFGEVLSVGLFTPEQYRDAFHEAGCDVVLEPALALADGRPNSPGLFVGVRR